VVGSAGSGAIATAQSIWRVEGFRGFWRGLVPPLLGSTAYRGVLFSAYSAAFAACKDTPLAKPVPGLGGLAPAVVVGAVAAASARTAVETPLELIKVRRMLKQPWMTGSGVGSLFSVGQVLELYKGSSATLARSTGMLCTFFVLIDYTTRYFPVAIATPIIGPFIKGGLCTTIGWAVAWPAEVVKSRVQGDTTGTLAKKSTISLIRDVARQVSLSLSPSSHPAFHPPPLPPCLPPLPPLPPSLPPSLLPSLPLSLSPQTPCPYPFTSIP